MNTTGAPRRRRLRTVVVGAAVVLSVLLATPVDAKETSMRDVDGNTIKVSVVFADGSTKVGASTPAPSPEWPYECSWALPWVSTDVIYAVADGLLDGHRYHLTCTPKPWSDAPLFADFVIYRITDPIPIPGAYSSLDILNDIRDDAERIPLPLLVGSNPEALQITGIETWFWPDGSVDSFQVAAEAAGLRVTVEARWQRTTFDVGEDGVAPIVCEAVEEWRPGSEDSDCAHSFTTESDARTITASSEWDLYWWDNGAQTTEVFWETLVLDEQTVVEVRDLEAVISRG